MDPSVDAALAKWPDVPDVYGWLGLTVRGEWRLQGQPIGNAALREFIGRNYGGDARGRWYFQNGPQRVYVELAATPWIWRAGSASVPELTAHTGVRAHRLHGAWLDEAGSTATSSRRWSSSGCCRPRWSLTRCAGSGSTLAGCCGATSP